MPDNTLYMHIVPGSRKYYCRVEDCSDYTWANIPFGYCLTHLRTNVMMEMPGPMREKVGWPPVGTQLGQQLSVSTLTKT